MFFVNTLLTDSFILYIIFIPWKLIYYQEFPSRAEAMRRERYLKSLKNKKYLLKIIDAG